MVPITAFFKINIILSTMKFPKTQLYCPIMTSTKTHCPVREPAEKILEPLLSIFYNLFVGLTETRGEAGRNGSLNICSAWFFNLLEQMARN